MAKKTKKYTEEDILKGGEVADGYRETVPDAGNKTRINLRNIRYSELAQYVSEAIPQHALFWKNGEYCTIVVSADGRSYTERPMSALRFSTWVEKFINFRATAAVDAAPTSLSEAQSRMVLASDYMRDRTPELKEISPVRLPMLSPGHDLRNPVFEPAPLGYDATTQIFTVDGLPIDWGTLYKRESVIKSLIWIFEDFPFDGGDRPLLQCRSFAAAVCAMLGQFLRHVIDKFPLVIFNANQEGTGKTFLARALLSPMLGDVKIQNYVEDENEMRKTLNATILAGAPVCFLDDLRSLVSNAINRFVTSDSISDRKLGGNEMFEVKHKTQFFVTGNMLKTSRDIERRSLPVDMFCEGDATRRVVRNRISEPGILTDSWRANMLSALWSLVAGWVAAGCPRDPRTESRISSFSAFKIAVHITMWAGLMDPFGERQVNLDTGDAMGEALHETVVAIATGMTTEMTASYTIDDIMERARLIHKLEIITNGAKDPKRSIGQQMRRFKGRVFEDELGRRFQVGNKRTSASSLYTFTILDPNPETFAPLQNYEREL